MFPFFSRPKEKENSSLLLEIQSGLVRGAVLKEGSQKPEIVNRYSLPFTATEKTSVHLTNAMLHALLKVAKKLTHTHYVETVHVVMTSPWVFSQSKTVEMNFDKDTAIDNKIMASIIQNDTNNQEDSTYIERKIFEIKLNGYAVENFEKRMAKKISVAFATTVSSRKLLQKIHRTLERAFKIRKIQYHSGLLLDFLALRKFFTDKSDYIYIHSHSELTDIVVVQSNVCSHISSFPIGTASLAKALPESTLAMIDKNSISETERSKINPALLSYFSEWLAHINTLVDMKTAPKFVYISTHAYLNIFKEQLKESWGKEYHIHTFEPDTLEMYSIALQDVV